MIMTASLTFMPLIGVEALSDFDLGSGVPPEQINKVLPYLTNRDAYSPDVVEMWVTDAFLMVRGPS